MINARRHTEKLFIYTVLFNILEGCYADNPEKDKGKLETELLEIKAAERDPKKADKNMIRAIKLAQHLMKDNENGLKMLLAARHLLQTLIDNGFEPKEIKEYFDDKPVLTALSYYAENDDLDDEDFETNEDEW